MPDFYNDLDNIYHKLNEKLAQLNEMEITSIEKERLIMWMKAVLRELQVYVEALAENKLSSEAVNQ
jgi:hypothetical protein